MLNKNWIKLNNNKKYFNAKYSAGESEVFKD